MRHIKFPDSIDTVNRRLPFFLATEEWVARHLPEGEYFFSWQVDPTVICGRNQDILNEVNLEYCRNNSIDVVRRRSGGGAVFADRENFMFSYITSGDNVTQEFARYTSMIAEALCNIGIDAVATGRNDITINGKKVSGNAFYHIPGRCIAHGTMLYNFDPVHISKALTPSKAKLESKGVKSVHSRVTCLKQEGISLSPLEFERYMIQSITDGNPYIIDDSDLDKILRLESRYYYPSFMKIDDQSNPNLIQSDEMRLISNHLRLDGIGEFLIEYGLDRNDIINSFRISGDFFMCKDVDRLICDKLNGVKLDKEILRKVIDGIRPESVIPGLTKDSLLKLILSQFSTRMSH